MVAASRGRSTLTLGRMVDVATIQRAWSWTGIDPIELVRENDFGNLTVKDSAGRYWRICPEELRCSVIADSEAEFDRLLASAEFRHDWEMVALCEEGRTRFGPLLPGRKYCLKIPAALGGGYDRNNLDTISLAELIGASGDMAKQIATLPDGTSVRLVVTK